MTITMQEIADRAGVSRPVVCSVLGGHTTCRCSKEKREEILALVDKLGYQPNLQARRLRQGRTRTVAILFASFRDRIVGDLTLGFYRGLLKRGYTSILCIWESREEIEAAYRNAVANRVDGVITCDYHPEWLPDGLPIVVYGDAPKGVDCVRVKYRRAFDEAVAHLRTLGHRRFGYIGLGCQRREEFLAACAAAGLAEPAVYGGLSFIETGSEGMADLLSRKKRPTAIFCHNDVIALSACGEAARRGLAVGRDVSVVGLDNMLESRLFTPALTTIDTFVADKADRMVEMLLARIETPSAPPVRVDIEAKFVPRASIGPCAAE